MFIRDVRTTDAQRLTEIYSYYVEKTAVSFEYKTPTVQEFGNRIEKISRKYPYLVCEDDGRITGYVYASAYSTREAYDWTVATSIYVDRAYRRKGVGKALYAALEERLKEQGIVNLLAGVAYCEKEDEFLSHDSIDFHAKMGYEKVAQMKQVGKKFGRWYDLVWMQKRI